MRALLATLALAVGSMALMPLNPTWMDLNTKPVGIAMRMGNGRLFGRIHGRFGLSLRSSGISRRLCHFNKRLVLLVGFGEMLITFNGPPWYGPYHQCTYT